ncbi:hypothetical protein [Paraburkholderia azotifigens]|uniref:Uncharacterized protein n=1 Tax=Paraburkholderia azotifigens TaxID=2057004 RepID=A0ABU9RGG1_9BURK
MTDCELNEDAARHLGSFISYRTPFVQAGRHRYRLSSNRCSSIYESAIMQTSDVAVGVTHITAEASLYKRRHPDKHLSQPGES